MNLRSAPPTKFSLWSMSENSPSDQYVIKSPTWSWLPEAGSGLRVCDEPGEIAAM
jgi:hypothetical protein